MVVLSVWIKGHVGTSGIRRTGRRRRIAFVIYEARKITLAITARRNINTQGGVAIIIGRTSCSRWASTIHRNGTRQCIGVCPRQCQPAIGYGTDFGFGRWLRIAWLIASDEIASFASHCQILTIGAGVTVVLSQAGVTSRAQFGVATSVIQGLFTSGNITGDVLLVAVAL